MATTVKSYATEGIEGFPVEIEVSSIHGLPCLSIIGFPDQSIKEAGDRIRAAIIGTGYKFPEALFHTIHSILSQWYADPIIFHCITAKSILKTKIFICLSKAQSFFGPCYYHIIVNNTN